MVYLADIYIPGLLRDKAARNDGSANYLTFAVKLKMGETILSINYVTYTAMMRARDNKARP